MNKFVATKAGLIEQMLSALSKAGFYTRTNHHQILIQPIRSFLRPLQSYLDNNLMISILIKVEISLFNLYTIKNSSKVPLMTRKRSCLHAYIIHIQLICVICLQNRNLQLLHNWFHRFRCKKMFHRLLISFARKNLKERLNLVH